MNLRESIATQPMRPFQVRVIVICIFLAFVAVSGGAMATAVLLGAGGLILMGLGALRQASSEDA